MIILCQTYLNVLKIKGIALFPFILVHQEEAKTDLVLINHEKIHLRQQAEMLLFFFYLIYFAEYLWGLWRWRNKYLAYQNISFEREAFANELDLDYLKNRSFWAFKNYYPKNI